MAASHCWDTRTYGCSSLFAIWFFVWVLDCEIPFGGGIVPTDKDDFEEQLANYLCDLPEYHTLSDEDFDRRLKEEVAKYDPYWKHVIAIHADN